MPKLHCQTILVDVLMLYFFHFTSHSVKMDFWLDLVFFYFAFISILIKTIVENFGTIQTDLEDFAKKCSVFSNIFRDYSLAQLKTCCHKSCPVIMLILLWTPSKSTCEMSVWWINIWKVSHEIGIVSVWKPTGIWILCYVMFIAFWGRQATTHVSACNTHTLYLLILPR